MSRVRTPDRALERYPVFIQESSGAFFCDFLQFTFLYFYYPYKTYTGGYKTKGDKIIYSLSNSYNTHLILDENQEYNCSLHTEYALILTKNSTDSTKETYSIYNYDRKVCDIGSRFDKLCDNVNLYYLDDKYYNYEEKLIYEKKGNN